MDNIDLNIDNYNLQELLNLFSITENFSEKDMKEAKKVVLRTHPDKSGLDKKYFRADVVNHSDYLEVFSHAVLNPAYIRYAWSDTSVASLFNSEGLPASSFKFENE